MKSSKDKDNRVRVARVRVVAAAVLTPVYNKRQRRGSRIQ